MEYTKQTWTAPTGTGLSRYAKSAESASHVILTLDPVNLTNSPTPFTMARMAHMEDGIAKAYDTAPPTPWAQYSGKDIPQLPDNLAGTTYKRDNDWTTTDGWTASGGTVSVGDNKLICISSTGDPYITKSGFSFSGASNRFIYLYLTEVPAGNIAGQVFYSTSGHGISLSYVKDFAFTKKGVTILDMGVLSAGDNDWITSTITGLRFDLGNLAGKTFIIQSIYIGTGAYDRLVFDNSYHYRHLLNNAVVPTPQGLYFNGSTSYLRSKEPVTLPDVFTFSATVNCTKTATYQRILEITGRLYIYRSQNTNNLAVGYYNPTTSSIEAAGIGNFFTDNIDIDTKIEIDFINKTIKLYKNNILFYNATVTGIQKPTEEYLYIGSERGLGNVLLGYMRNIQLFDTALTDTQRNWLAQGNTPPILYDVTNYETEGYVSIQDADGTNTGVETDVDSNGNRILKLPATIKATLSGNASTADKWKTARNITISDADGTNTGAAVLVDGSENETLKLPATIKASITGNVTGNLTGNVTGYAGSVSKANVRVSLRHGNTWFDKTLGGATGSRGNRVWTDGENIYYSYQTAQFVLNKDASTWVVKTWTGLTDFIGQYIWTDGENIYYSYGTTHYVLNKDASTWVAKSWTGLTDFNADNIWTDGENVYHSNSTNQFVLNKTTSTWVAKSWTGLTDFNADNIWTDGENVYHSNSTNQFVLNKTTSTWVVKTWTGLTDFIGNSVWTDGENVYHSNSTNQFVLNKTTSTWVAKSWTGLTDFNADNIWTDGYNIYYSNITQQFVLPATRHNYVDDAKYNSLFGIVTDCTCKTLSNRFVFANE